MFAVKLAIQTGWDEQWILSWPWPRLALYMAAAHLEPFGGRHEDYRSGELLALIYNAHRGKDSPSLRGRDWYPSLQPEAKPVEAESEIDIGRLFVQAMGGEVW